MSSELRDLEKRLEQVHKDNEKKRAFGDITGYSSTNWEEQMRLEIQIEKLRKKELYND